MTLSRLFFLFKIYTCVLLMDISNPIKEKNRLRKEINRLLNKGMPNIYLKVTIEKN